jgi:2'-5' RNA ligase
MRAFIAVEINEEVRRKLLKVQEGLKATGADLKLVDPENIHITLKFLGEIPEEKLQGITQALDETVAGVPSFDAQIKGIGVFPSLNYIRVVWAGVREGGDKIKEIQRSLDLRLQKLGFKLERDFVPHLTFARVRSPKNKERLVAFVKGLTNEEFGISRVESIELKQSKLTPRGPVYTTVAKVGFTNTMEA